jgi:hypothetical protein
MLSRADDPTGRVAAGSPLAAGVISLLASLVFDDLSGGNYLAVRLTGAYLWAFSGALLAYATLLWPAYQATRRTVVQFKVASSRPPKEAAFTRYYLDLALVGLGAVLFFQLQRRGNLVTEKLFGEQSTDPVALLTPTFFILTVAIFFLRLFPRFVCACPRPGHRDPSTWQLVRPAHLLAPGPAAHAATAVGTFRRQLEARSPQATRPRGIRVGAPFALPASERPMPTDRPRSRRPAQKYDATVAAAALR